MLKQNASVALNAVQYYCPPVRRLATQMEIALGQRLNVNAYMTFGPGGAFAMHYNSHDVFVLQVHGSKHWFIYDQPAASPIDYVQKANRSRGRSFLRRYFKRATSSSYPEEPITELRSPTRIRCT